jgi:hypothetical protein
LTHVLKRIRLPTILVNYCFEECLTVVCGELMYRDIGVCRGGLCVLANTQRKGPCLAPEEVWCVAGGESEWTSLQTSNIDTPR